MSPAHVRPFSVTLALVLAAALAVATAGCGSKPGTGEVSAREGATLVITRDFGASELREPRVLPLGGNLSAMRQLQSSAEVESSFGGRYVTAIDGVKQDLSDGYDWLFYVDGVESAVGAAAVDLTAGQTVQWDYHRWRDVKTGGAIVGAFPAPLDRDGVALECVPQVTAACVSIKQKLREAKIRINTKGVPLFVGQWSELARRDLEVDLSSDPAGNGAFAAFPGGRKLELAGDDGSVARTLGAQSGLVAAFSRGDSKFWVVTGVDTLGVEAAVAAFNERSLANRFSVAVGDDGVIGLPVSGAGGQE